MCRALKVLCVAPDAKALATLKRASVAADWELSPGATTSEEALAQLADGRAHLLVVSGPFGELVKRARAVYPGLRIVADFDASEVNVTVDSFDEIRGAIKDVPRPGGPVRAPDASA
ncbi:MAG: hypothetical protein WD004_05490 [Actinomycetota bacterium]